MASTYEIRSMIQQTAQQYGVDPNLALAVAQRESSLNPYARGQAQELGLFQKLNAHLPVLLGGGHNGRAG
jgi:soluble lytic murein transglycosylase-like protein